MKLSQLALTALALALGGVSAQSDPVAQVPPSESAQLYPAYTYVPSVDGNYVPHPHGAPQSSHNSSVNPAHARPAPPSPPQGPPSLPPLSAGHPSGFWYEQIKHDGTSPFIANGSNWKVYRNVKDYGAKGDGHTDDTVAVLAAINDQDRGPGGNGKGTTGAPAVVYFPSGTYVISNSIPMYVDTILMGNPIARPTLLAAAGFKNDTLVKGFDPAFDAPTNFYMSVKNLVLDSTHVGASDPFLLLDWGVSQATQLTNTLFRMPRGSAHTGVSTVEGGSGTFMGNLDFEGGAIGLNYNNQQYNIKDVTFTGCDTGVVISHGFDIVFQGLEFKDCRVGINGTVGGVGNVGSYALIDSQADSVDTLIVTKTQTNGSSTTGDDSVVIDNLRVTNVNKTVVAGTKTLLKGSVPKTWVYGNAYTQGGPVGGVHDNGVTYQTSRSSALLSGGNYFTMAPPTYQEYSVSQVVNIKDVKGYPVYGDGQTDDTANINAILKRNAGCAVTFFPAGTYIVTSTINIPPGSRLFGEAWSAISASGAHFADEKNPQVMVRIGKPGDVGTAQISEMLFTVADVLPGCILVEVNMAGTQPGDVATWNTHFRVGGAAGSGVQTKCGDDQAPCQAAFMLMHLRKTASIYIEDMWGWTADHDLDGDNNQVISTGRGLLAESQKPVWLVGTAFEHNTLYQYNLIDAAEIYTGMQQCETPYWQGVGSPALAPAPWTPNTAFHDPTFDNCNQTDANCRMAWYQRVSGGHDLYIYGTGFWTFFNHQTTCQGVNGTCQDNAVEITNNPQRLFWWNHNTRGVLNMVVDQGKVLATQNNNPGSWGAIVAAVLTHSGLTAHKLLARLPGQVAQAFEA